jgi:hypothetical protein
MNVDQIIHISVDNLYLIYPYCVNVMHNKSILGEYELRFAFCVLYTYACFVSRWQLFGAELVVMIRHWSTSGVGLVTK